MRILPFLQLVVAADLLRWTRQQSRDQFIEHNFSLPAFWAVFD